MTVPSDFRKNTDWMTIAELRRDTMTCIVLAGQWPSSGTQERVIEWTMDSSIANPGAIDRVSITYEGKTCVCSFAHFRLRNTAANLSVTRNSSGKVNIKLKLSYIGGGDYTYPRQDYTISVVQFKPPNII